MIDADPDRALPDASFGGLNSFEQAVGERLDRLCADTRITGWMLTRVLDSHWTCVGASSGSAARRGASAAWLDVGPGEPLSPRLPSRDVAPDTAAGGGSPWIHAVRLRRRDHSCFGTLCTVGDMSTSLLDHQRDRLQVAGSDLATLVEHEFIVAHQSRLTHRSLVTRWRDSATRTLDPDGWQRALVEEEQTRQPLLSPAVILAMRLPANAEPAFRRLRQALGDDAVVASTAGNGVIALLPDCGTERGKHWRQRAQQALQPTGIRSCTLEAAPWDCALQAAAQRALDRAILLDPGD